MGEGRGHVEKAGVEGKNMVHVFLIKGFFVIFTSRMSYLIREKERISILKFATLLSCIL